jgi:hypothetical protein
MLDGPLSSACPTYPSPYGTLRLTVTVGVSGDYAIWTHLLPDSDLANSYYLQVDGLCPTVVGGVPALSGAWYWIDSSHSFAAGPRARVVAGLSAGTHTLTLIGRQANVVVDTLLLTTDLSCVPRSAAVSCDPTGS